MYRLVTQIESKYMRGPCGPPYKRYIQFQERSSPRDTFSPKKNFIIENFGESYLFRNIKMDRVSNQEESLPLIRSNIVLVMGLSNQSVNEMIKALEKQRGEIMEIEIIKDRNKRNLLVVVFLLNQQAEEFYIRYNFSMMPDDSHLVTVFLEDVVYVMASESKHPEHVHLLLTGNISSEERDDVWIQLPLCLSCLEKLESRLSGIHYLEYGEEIQARKPSANCSLCTLSKQSIKCNRCQETKEIWGCLICGSLGCGRYKDGHAQIHSYQKNHIFAMEINTNGIWNYQQDTFVHRILVGDVDVVLLSENNLGENQGESTDGISWDFCNQITEQLQKQRGYYQSKIQEQESKYLNERQQLEKELSDLKEVFLARSKEAGVIRSKREKQEKKRNVMRQRIQEQKEMNKLVESSIRELSEPAEENKAIKRKREELAELEGRLNQLLTQLDF